MSDCGALLDEELRDAVASAISATTDRMESVLPLQACNEATTALEGAIASRDVALLKL